MCPHCKTDFSKVTETRRHENEVWRRRKCLSCRKVFFSKEYSSTVMEFPKAVKVESLNRLKACDNRTRSYLTIKARP
jgi:transcriptional regulator NrdR family protein